MEIILNNTEPGSGNLNGDGPLGMGRREIEKDIPAQLCSETSGFASACSGLQISG